MPGFDCGFQSSVAGRVSKFLETYEGLICLTGVDYVMYAKDALKGRDQNRQIAPLVVERFQGANVNERDNRRTGTTGRRSQSSVEEHQKVTQNTEVVVIVAVLTACVV